MSPKDAIEMLIRFSRLVSGTNNADEILPVLARSAVDLLGAQASAVLQVSGLGDARVVAAEGLPDSLRGWHPEFETISSELGEALMAAAGRTQGAAYTVPMVSGGDLFGALVLLFDESMSFDSERLRLAEGLTDLAAIALGKAFQFAQLQRSATELRASRDALFQGEKLRALGQMAAGISHDLKNILNPLALQLQLLKRRARKDPAAVDEVIAQIEDVVRHGLDTVERLRAFSRQQQERLIDAQGEADIDRIVDEAVELCRPRLRMAKADIRIEVEKGAPSHVAVNGPDLLNSVVNLVVNAVDAMPDGGSIQVRTGQSSESNGGPDHVWIEVVDDGCGIPEDVQARVFEPFFTTKGKEGTGLGLAMVYAFVKRSGGLVKLESAPGRGTRLRMAFPVAQRRPAAVATTSEA